MFKPKINWGNRQEIHCTLWANISQGTGQYEGLLWNKKSAKTCGKIMYRLVKIWLARHSTFLVWSNQSQYCLLLYSFCYYNLIYFYPIWIILINKYCLLSKSPPRYQPWIPTFSLFLQIFCSLHTSNAGGLPQRNSRY